MIYRIDKQGLLDSLSVWNGFLKRKVHLVACGGTALTLLDIKASTKDIDLLMPETDEYNYLLKILKDLGYKSASGVGWARDDGFTFDLFRGKSVHTTELLESPLVKGNNVPVKEFSYIYLGVLNYYDLLISKLFRGTGVDMDDCMMLMKAKRTEIDIARLSQRFKETASYDVSEDKVNNNLEHFIRLLKKEGI
ncbi:MAG: hypothetical protein KKH77_01380 [Candidatus Omnitrophica bacterium]|nr:hypothetical protein [Candidatus Omnitrophota bacterium]MBU0881173.1 hypothetical protein [Candidatus Omnitrophota bacterium]MBU1037630.1 hypothetical protein [Candidatus Omnitrophota bacterium]MBU1809253.1 hypothetical protein [Candidatus Omnitrophota bacterium]